MPAGRRAATFWPANSRLWQNVFPPGRRIFLRAIRVQYIEPVFNRAQRILYQKPLLARKPMFSIMNTYSVGRTQSPLRSASMADQIPSTATAVERALTILEAAAQRREGLTNSEISRRLAIPKSSASYILRVLDRRGYLRRDAATGRYRLGLRLLSLGKDAQSSVDLA